MRSQTGSLSFIDMAFWVDDIKTLKSELIAIGVAWGILHDSLNVSIVHLHWTKNC